MLKFLRIRNTSRAHKPSQCRQSYNISSGCNLYVYSTFGYSIFGYSDLSLISKWKFKSSLIETRAKIYGVSEL